ncbi:uncharacterized protein PHALS_14853 [Plasmopara halstedii]|uniref:Uncharacterized protein n=1 Tax=Plasmopara halstedii TaxID=4781 RepID=A0A0P1AUW4_PLAHL|nr:uncharacterized protein PHALS_14853 [Plasmopara halstedii]CEG45965.1 hypothetical protein PHALS_14853 [Plasmopara halstedii]|eukprot:XP_024582334.1 hypothetical protein PHALS_14853 [Plasmopara halstedii]
MALNWAQLFQVTLPSSRSSNSCSFFQVDYLKSTFNGLCRRFVDVSDFLQVMDIFQCCMEKWWSSRNLRLRITH